MAIRKVGVPILILLLSLFCGRLMAQVTEEVAKKTDEMYSHFYNADLQAVSPNNKRGIVVHKNNYSIRRAYVLDMKTKSMDSLAYASSYEFFGDDIVISKLGDRTVLNHLGKNLRTEAMGSYIYIPFHGAGKFVLYEKRLGKLLIYNSGLKVAGSFENVENISLLKDQSSIVFSTKDRIISLDVRTLQISEWKSSGKAFWLQRLDSEALAIVSKDGIFYLDRHSSSGKRSTKLTLPEGFYIDSLSWSHIEVRDRRYLILPVRKAAKKSTPALGEILYTNQSSSYQGPVVQMAVYDLKGEVWKRLPKDSDVTTRQIFADDKGTILTYDPTEDKVDSLETVRYKVIMEKDFGGTESKIANPYTRRSNFHFDQASGRMVYFVDQRWWIENTNDGTVSQIPFEMPDSFVGDHNGGLSDDPSGNVHPTSHFAKCIISNDHDLFLVDLIKLSVERLTFGREKNISYELPLDKTKIFKGKSPWEVGKNPQVDLDRKILLKVFDRVSYGSGIAELDYRASKIKELVRIDDDIKQILVSGSSLIYTSQSYGRPLSVYLLKNKVPELVYRSAGVDRGSLANLRKEMIRYEVDGKAYNAALLYPLNYDGNRRYPLIFNVYEKKSKDVLHYMSPNLYANQGFDVMHYVYSSYFVLLPDLSLEPEHVGRSMSRSVENLVEILKKNESIDIRKMAVAGSSFGGYGTTFLMTQHKFFVTGFAGVSVVDLPRKAMTFYKDFKLPAYFRVEKNQNRMVKSLFDNYQGYLDNSPIYHLKNIRSPILMWLGKNDGNVDPDQSRAFFLGLKRLSKKGILIEYPQEKHNLMKRENQFDVNVKGWQWMDHYLMDNKPAEWIVPLLD